MPCRNASTKTAASGKMTITARNASARTVNETRSHVGSVTARRSIWSAAPIMSWSSASAAALLVPTLQPVDDEQHAESGDQYDRSDRRSSGVVVLLELYDDQQRRDLRYHGQVAGDEDHRAVLAQAAGEGEREAGEDRRQDRRQYDAQEGLYAAGAEARRGLLRLHVEILQDRLDSANDERQSYEHQGDDDPGRRERHLQAESGERRADPAVLGIEGCECYASDRGRERKGQVDDGVDQPLAGKRVAHQHPGDDQPDEGVDRRRDQGSAEAEPVRGQRTRGKRRRHEAVQSHARRLDDESRERHEHDDAEVEQRQTNRQPEAGHDALLAQRTGRPVGPRGGLER